MHKNEIMKKALSADDKIRHPLPGWFFRGVIPVSIGGQSMTHMFNEAVMSMINDGYLSANKVRRLVYIKELVDRVSTRKYLEEMDVQALKEKYGVMPNIVSWGDYFQTELATTLKDMTDSSFDRVMETVRFDLISSYTIFSEQTPAFFEWVNTSYEGIMSLGKDDYTEDEKEIIHLKILLEYYTNLGMVNNFTPAEMLWYESYEEAAAV